MSNPSESRSGWFKTVVTFSNAAESSVGNLAHGQRMLIFWPSGFSGTTVTIKAMVNDDETAVPVNDGAGSSGLSLTVVPGEATAVTGVAESLMVASVCNFTLTSNGVETGDVSIVCTR